MDCMKGGLAGIFVYKWPPSESAVQSMQCSVARPVAERKTQGIRAELIHDDELDFNTDEPR